MPFFRRLSGKVASGVTHYLKRFRAHVRRHPKAYVVAATGLVVGAVALVAARQFLTLAEQTALQKATAAGLAGKSRQAHNIVNRANVEPKLLKKSLAAAQEKLDAQARDFSNAVHHYRTEFGLSKRDAEAAAAMNRQYNDAEAGGGVFDDTAYSTVKKSTRTSANLFDNDAFVRSATPAEMREWDRLEKEEYNSRFDDGEEIWLD
jgi:hypothetical protein